MNTVRIGVIAIWAAVGVCGYLSLRDVAPDEMQATRLPAEHSGRSQTERLAAGDRVASREAEPARDAGTLASVAEPELEPGTSDVPQSPRTLNHIVDALNADIGPEGEYVDPETLAALLRSDPELSRKVNE